MKIDTGFKILKSKVRRYSMRNKNVQTIFVCKRDRPPTKCYLYPFTFGLQLFIRRCWAMGGVPDRVDGSNYLFKSYPTQSEYFSSVELIKNILDISTVLEVKGFE